MTSKRENEDLKKKVDCSSTFPIIAKCQLCSSHIYIYRPTSESGIRILPKGDVHTHALR